MHLKIILLVSKRSTKSFQNALYILYLHIYNYSSITSILTGSKFNFFPFKKDNFVSDIIIEVNIIILPIIILPVTTSCNNIIENKVPNTASVESIIAVFIPSTLFWHIVWTKNAKVVLNTPRYKAPIYPLIFAFKLPSPSKIWTIKESTKVTVNWTPVNTIGSCFLVNSPVKNICSAYPKAHIIVKKSPILIDKSFSKESIPMPINVSKLLITPILSNFLLYIKNPINGTITTFTAVKNVFLDGVVYTSPIVWTTKAINKNAPSIAPHLIASLLIFSFIRL